MIRTNLSTRPFYNARLVTAGVAVLALLVVAATAFNLSRAMVYAGTNTELVAQASQDESTARDLTATATKLRATVDPRQIEAASAEAREANALIDRRTLSWTGLFNQFEATLPAEARITAVRPTIDRDRTITVVVTVAARSVDDIDQFMQRLDATGVFIDVRSTREQTTEQGQIASTLEMIYKPAADAAPAPAAAAAAGAR
jgi:hypothetical protein